MTRAEAAALDTVLRWVTGIPTVGQRLPSTDEALAAATLLTRGAHHYRPVITTTELADRWPSTPPAGERAASLAAAVAVLHQLADDMACVIGPGETFDRDALVDAVHTRADQIQDTGVPR